jgi:hypothetical protein
MANDELALLPPLTRLLFIYLWMLADREGRLEDRPNRIAAQALPYDRSADVEQMLDELQAGGFIRRYEEGRAKCIQIVAFSKHQNPHAREVPSELPAEQSLGDDKAQPRQCLEQGKSSPSTEPARLIPSSLIPDSLILIPEKEIAAPRQVAAPPPPPFDGRNQTELNGKCIVELAANWELPADWGEDAERLGWDVPDVLRESERFRQYWVSGKGKGKRRAVKGWRQSWSNWLGKAAENRR